MFRIIDIAREISSGITPLRSNSEYWENGTIPWLKTEQIGEYRIKTTNEFVTEKALESTGLKLYPKNTISIAMYGEGKTRGNVSIIDCPMTTNQACCNIVVNESIVAPFYLYYFFKTQYHNLRQLSSGVRKNLNTNDIKNYLINLPNKITQQNIVNFLCSIDEKIELNNKINLELEKIAKTLYEYWFVQFDFPDENERPYKSSGGKMIYNEILKREIPIDWEVKTIEQNIKKSFSSKKISSNNYQNYGKIPIIDQSPQFICGYTNDVDYLIKYDKKPYIVFGDHSCTLKLVNFDFARGADGTQIIICGNENINQYYLYFAIKNIKLSSSYERHYKYLKDSKIVIPNNTNLTNKFEIITDNIYANIRKNIQENNLLVLLRDFLLPMLMNGQISIVTTE